MGLVKRIYITNIIIVDPQLSTEPGSRAWLDDPVNRDTCN